MSTATSSRTIGASQPICSVGPTMNEPAAAGKNAARSPSSVGAFATGSSQNSTLPAAPLASRSRSTSTSARRFIPTRPPTPVIAKPNPSWMPGQNRTPSTATNELPPPGASS